MLPAPWMLNRSPRSAVSALGLCPLQSCSSMHIAACSSQESAPTTWHQPYPRLVRWMSRSSHIQNQNPAFAWLFETTAPALGIVGPDLCPPSALASSSLVSELILQQATNGLLKICPDGLLSSSVRSLPRGALVLCCCTCRFNWILPRLFSLQSFLIPGQSMPVMTALNSWRRELRAPKRPLGHFSSRLRPTPKPSPIQHCLSLCVASRSSSRFPKERRDLFTSFSTKKKRTS